MEKKISRNKILEHFLKQAKNPFISVEQKLDIKKILLTSDTMRGMNHLYLVRCYFSESSLFYISKEEAIKQAYLALQENNYGAFYYLYFLLKDIDFNKAKGYLILSAFYGNAKAHIELGKLYYDGLLVEKNFKKSYEHFKIASECHKKEGFFGMLLIASVQGDYELEQEIYNKAKEENIILPGIVK